MCCFDDITISTTIHSFKVMCPSGLLAYEPKRLGFERWRDHHSALVTARSQREIALMHGRASIGRKALRTWRAAAVASRHLDAHCAKWAKKRALAALAINARFVAAVDFNEAWL
jgi:hypothetical protein